MRVDGRNHTIYECDNTSKRKTSGGTVYSISNNQGLEAMLLDRSLCTKEKEIQVVNAMNGIGEWYGPQIRDILYTHGKFRGYVYYKVEEPASEITTEESPEYTNNVQETPGRAVSPPKYNLLIRVIYLIAAIIIMAAMGLRILYPSMLQASLNSGSDAGSLFAAISFDGTLGAVIGAIAACVCAWFWISKNAILYYVGIPVIAVVFTALVYFLIKMIILLVGMAINIFVALIPSIITIAVIIALVKSVFK